MTKHTKALIFSAFIFPGLGQLALSRYKSAIIFIGSALAAFIFILSDVMSKASTIADKIIAGEMSAEYSDIRKTLLDQQTNSDSQLITLLTYLLIAVWLLSVIDILRLRKTMKKKKIKNIQNY